MSRRSILIAAIISVVFAGLAGWWWLRAPLAAALTLQVVPLVRTVQFSARVATTSRVDIGATVTGRVLQVAVIEGAEVRRGELLLSLESEELQAALAQAQAGERQAAANLAGQRDTGRRSAQATLTQTDSVLLAARAALKRTGNLVASGFLSPAKLDEAERDVEVALAQQAGARSQRAANAEEGTETRQARAQLAVAVSATAAAQARLAQAVLRAPADARVLARMVEPGQIVQPGRALLSLALSGAPQLAAQADERFLEQLRVGQSATVVADAFPGQRFAARVQSIAPLVDAQRGAVAVKFSLPQATPAFLREDMTLSVEVETARREKALVLPAGALRSDDGTGGATAWTERRGRVERRALRLGLRTLDGAEVLEGFAAGDTVLIGKAPEPGRRVKVDRGAAAVAAAAAVKPGPAGAGAAMTEGMGR
ncbi:MAG: efflux RND transporter periplasmic adaptor subunit [Burkholderiales bacterium]